MGFRRIIQLRYAEGSGLEGMEVDLRPVTVNQSMQLRAGRMEDEPIEDFNRRQIGILLGAVVSWNLEDDNGDPLPQEVEAVFDWDLAVIVRILDDWSEGSRLKVDSPLDETSNAGSSTEPSSEDLASIPTETLPPNQ